MSDKISSGGGDSHKDDGGGSMVEHIGSYTPCRLASQHVIAGIRHPLCLNTHLLAFASEFTGRAIEAEARSSHHLDGRASLRRGETRGHVARRENGSVWWGGCACVQVWSRRVQPMVEVGRHICHHTAISVGCSGGRGPQTRMGSGGTQRSRKQPSDVLGCRSM